MILMDRENFYKLYMAKFYDIHKLSCMRYSFHHVAFHHTVYSNPTCRYKLTNLSCKIQWNLSIIRSAQGECNFQ